ncbi:MAG: M14 family zinc carboxypeptidase [Desulfosporosinus sp.]
MSTVLYGGPGNHAYAVVGSLDAGDQYNVLWEEYGWKFIDYPAGSKRKRAYLQGGAYNPYPSSFQSGVLGKMSSGQYVYGGPSTSTYAQIGSLSVNENITVLIPNEAGFAFVEYSTSNGSKRGYILTGTFTITSTTALAKMLQDSPTYSEPYMFGYQIGSLYQEEYVVILQQNDTMSYVEYNTNSGRKRAYVFTFRLDKINTSAQVPSLEVTNDYIYAFLISQADVYSGPSQSNYALIGSVGPQEDIGMLHKENDWIYIQYATSGGAKRGFIPLSSVLSFYSGQGTVNDLIDKTGSYTGWADLTNAATPVYAGPSTSYSSIGSLAVNEGVTVFAGVENSFFQIEYTTTAGPKRGFIPDSRLNHYNLGGLAIVNGETIVVHYTPDLKDDLPRYGAIGNGEYVVILEKNDTRCYVEYNTSSARKRGYTTATGYTFKNMGNVGPLPDVYYSAFMTNVGIYVFAGPSDQYDIVGSLGLHEPLSKLRDDVLGYAYIQYSGNMTTKRGYTLPTNLIPYQVTVPDYSYLPNVTKGIYGQSGLGRDLVYYQIGTGNNHLILNFAIHGFEDNYDRDGFELVKVAGAMLQELSDNITPLDSHDWTVFVIPNANPDGLIEGYTMDGPGRCTKMRYPDGATQALPLIEGGVDLNRSFSVGFQVDTDPRYYTGPHANWAVESLALKNFIDTHKSTTGRNVFIDSHGWLQQVVAPEGSSDLLAILFGHYFSLNSITDLDNGHGYVAQYARSLGMEACLFEFPEDVTTPGDVEVKGYQDAFVNAIKDLINGIQY